MPPLFEKPPGNTLPPAKDRWTPMYFEHGRMEVDDSSIKWIGADDIEDRVRIVLKSKIEETRFLHRLPKVLTELFRFD